MAEDLLMCIAAGTIVKFIFHLYNGASFKSLFNAKYELTKAGVTTYLAVSEFDVFTNLLGYKKVLMNLTPQENVIVDFSGASLIAHSFMSFIHHFKNEYTANGGAFSIIGLENHKALSNHPLATRKLIKCKI